MLRENAILLVAAIWLGMYLAVAVDRLKPRLKDKYPALSKGLARVKPIAYALMIVAVIVFEQEAKAFVYFQF